MSEYFESIDVNQIKHHELVNRFKGEMSKLENAGMIVNDKIYRDDKPYTMADHRRDLNYNYCMDNDYIIWGESDCIFPKEIFSSLEQIKDYANQNNIHRFITTFAVRKMWDESWRILEHPKFTNEKYYDMDTEEDTRLATTLPHSIRYTMSWEEMDEVNSEYEELDVQMINYPKFDGSGLIISSDLIRAGANIPHAVYMNGDDTAMLESCRLVMGDKYVQFVVKNILKVHNRNHPKKRRYVLDEDSSKISHNKRKEMSWYQKFNKVSKENLSRLHNSQDKFNTYKDFEKDIKNEN
jgi:hypothetical protein